MINLGVLGSTKGTDLQVIIDAISEKKLNAKIAVVISNNSDAFILERAKNHDIPAKFISHKSKERHLFDYEITLILKKHKVDLVLLIGFMRILSSEFCKEWNKKIINVHPSLLPKYKGLHAVEQAMEAGEQYTGATVHYVTEELDGGPIIIQSKVPIMPDDDVKSLTKAIQRREYAVLPLAIEYVKHELQKPNSGYLLQDDIYGWDGGSLREDLDEQVVRTQQLC